MIYLSNFPGGIWENISTLSLFSRADFNSSSKFLNKKDNVLLSVRMIQLKIKIQDLDNIKCFLCCYHANNFAIVIK